MSSAAWERAQLKEQLLAVKHGESISYDQLLTAMKSTSVPRMLGLVWSLRKTLRREGYVFDRADGRERKLTRQTLQATTYVPEAVVKNVKKRVRVGLESVAGAVLPNLDKLSEADKHRALTGIARLGFIRAVTDQKVLTSADSSRAVNVIDDKTMDAERKRQLLLFLSESA